MSRGLCSAGADAGESHITFTIFFGIVGRLLFADLHSSVRQLHREHILVPMFIEMLFETID